MVSRSTDAAGEVPATVATGTFTTPITLSNTYTLAVGWDGSRFTFRINNEEKTYAPVTTINPPNVPWKAIGTRISDPAGKEATIEALFDDVVTYYGRPSAATLVSPSGAITDTTPTYTWNAVSDATWYQLYVNDSTGNRIQKWYSADACGCASGTGTCTVTPTTFLIGAGQWWIRAYNSAGYGPWSSSLSFSAPSLSGRWKGTMVSYYYGATTVEVIINQTGNNLSGTIIHPNFGNIPFSGIISGNSAYLTFSFWYSGYYVTGTLNLTPTVFDGNTLSGNYVMTQCVAGYCETDSGTFFFTRQ